VTTCLLLEACRGRLTSRFSSDLRFITHLTSPRPSSSQLTGSCAVKRPSLHPLRPITAHLFQMKWGQWRLTLSPYFCTLSYFIVARITTVIANSDFYRRNVMLARVLAVVVCLCVCLTPVLYRQAARIELFFIARASLDLCHAVF